MADDLILDDCLHYLPQIKRRSAALVIGSPPYALKGQRYPGSRQKWPVDDWVDWMYAVTRESLEVVTNAVVWICNGTVKDGEYQPAVEGLVWKLYMAGFICERPAIWHKNAPPNRKDWFGNDWEYCIAFRPPNRTRYFDYKAVGTAPKFKTGGHFRQRDSRGKRRIGSDYPTGKITRPRDVIRVTVGGGHMGSDLAHLNVAPFPEKIVEPFIKALTKKGELVVDPFCGSGTTCAVAQRLGRHYLGIELDPEQIAISRKRLGLEVVHG
jgi:site-specific DNA-methyltransferase (adenine-specific)